MKDHELSLEEQVNLIRRKRSCRNNFTRFRGILNTLFLLLAAIGLAMYFFGSTDHVPALIVIAVGMVFKVVEFVLRLL